MPQIVVEPAEDYFAKTQWVSRSMLAMFRKSRRLFHRHYIQFEGIEVPPTDPMVKGTAAHAVILEGRKLDDCFTIIPPDALNKDGHKKGKQWGDFQKANSGKQLLKREQVDEVMASIQAVLNHQGLKKLRALDCRCEHSIYWLDEANELQLRMRPDWLIERKDQIVCIDFKFTIDASPQGFIRQIIRGLWMQSAMYSDGLEKTFPGKPVDFVFAAVDSKEPYRCILHRLKPNSAYAARLAYERTKKQFAACLESDSFEEPCEATINEIDVPGKVFDDDFTIEEEPTDEHGTDSE